MIFPSIEIDYWQLRSGEASHAKNPKTFELPSLNERKNLKVGEAARLIFDIASVDDHGKVVVEGERMVVIVSECHPDYYIGLLDHEPVTFSSNEEEYLVFGAEVPFRAEHIIEILYPPEKYYKWKLSLKPERSWPR
jgi:hypothetical protein